MRSRRRSALPLIAIAACAAAAIPLIAQAAPGDDLPDLRADAPANPYLQNYTDGRLLLRFDGFVTNVDTGPLDISGNPQGTMWQRVNDGGTLVNERPVPVQYETADGHDHFHLMRIMRYSLRSGNAPSSPEVAPGQKVGFCLYDYAVATNFSGVRDSPVYALGRPGDDFCRQGRPGATSLRMGISSGWRDDYGSHLALQWVDVSDTTPGSYYLAADADPNDIVRESNENNPRAYMSSRVTIPGHVPRAIGPVSASGTAPTDIRLQADTFGSPSGLRYRIVRQPARGSVSLSGDTVRYTPEAGAPGTYTFEYSAASGSAYPRTPRTATVTLNVGGGAQAPSVAISGAPATLTAGTSAQLGATVANAAQGVTWTASAGSVSAAGLYTAPPAPPPGGVVTIRATSTAAPAAFAEAAIAIAPAPAPAPAPLTAGSGAVAPAGPRGVPAIARASQRLLGAPRLKRNGRIIVVRVVPRAGDRVAIAGIRGGRAHDVCVSRARAGRKVTCLLRVPARFAELPVRIAVGLRGDGGRAVTSTLSRP